LDSDSQAELVGVIKSRVVQTPLWTSGLTRSRVETNEQSIKVLGVNREVPSNVSAGGDIVE
jgi:hypothetical protein